MKRDDPTPPESLNEATARPPGTPFRRVRSKVFYASDSSLSSPRSDPILHRRPSIKRDRRAANTKSVSVICEAGEYDLNPTADEIATTLSAKSSPDCSPSGSWRGFECDSSTSWRCSPSQRSQDSGYSDSGESNSGAQNECKNDNSSHPKIKHITRVYFGESNKTGSGAVSCSSQSHVNSASNLNQINAIKTKRNFKVAKRRCKSSINLTSKNNHDTEDDNIFYCGAYSTSLSDRPNNSTSEQSLSLDEGDLQLEHKSLLLATSTPTTTFRKQCNKQFFKNLFSDQKSSKVGKLRGGNVSSKSLLNLPHLTPKKTSSTERLLDSCPRKFGFIKTRRRWSVSEIERISPTAFKFQPLLEKRSSSYCPSKDLSSLHLNEEEEEEEEKEEDKENDISFLSTGSDAELQQMVGQLGNNSLNQWLIELQKRCDSECMNTLQSKSVVQDEMLNVASRSKQIIDTIQREAHVVSTEFAFLCQKLENLLLDQVPPLVKSLVSYVESFIQYQCGQELAQVEDDKPKSSTRHQVRVVDQICSKLLETSELVMRSSIAYSSKGSENVLYTIPEAEEESDRKLIREFVKVVTALGHAFTKLVDLLLSREIQAIVRVLEESSSEIELRDAISQLTALGVDGGHVCRLVGRAGGIRALLALCVEPKRRKIRSLALRALATVSCVAEGIAYFEKESGVEVIADVLCDVDGPEEERSEAAGVLAQITSPWVEDNLGLPCLNGYMEQLVSALRDLAESTSSMEVFLLASAALANLTFLDGNCIDVFLKTSTHKVLLKKAQSQSELAVFIKDQIATVLANLSSGAVAAKEVVDADGISVLVSFLNTKPSDSSRLPEVDATERVQQKTAIAISRLSSELCVAQRVLELGGAERLVRLCKDEKERNYSDAVLVACLAALRKIATACGLEELRGVDASELVEPRLLDSFLIYSSQQESYV